MTTTATDHAEHRQALVTALSEARTGLETLVSERDRRQAEAQEAAVQRLLVSGSQPSDDIEAEAQRQDGMMASEIDRTTRRIEALRLAICEHDRLGKEAKRRREDERRQVAAEQAREVAAEIRPLLARVVALNTTLAAHCQARGTFDPTCTPANIDLLQQFLKQVGG